MLRPSNSKFTPAAVGDSVRVPVPEVYCSKCAARNIIRIVMAIDEEKVLFIKSATVIVC